MIGLKTDTGYECWLMITFWNMRLIEGVISVYSSAWACSFLGK